MNTIPTNLLHEIPTRKSPDSVSEHETSSTSLASADEKLTGCGIPKSKPILISGERFYPAGSTIAEPIVDKNRFAIVDLCQMGRLENNFFNKQTGPGTSGIIKLDGKFVIGWFGNTRERPTLHVEHEPSSRSHGSRLHRIRLRGQSNPCPTVTLTSSSRSAAPTTA